MRRPMLVSLACGTLIAGASYAVLRVVDVPGLLSSSEHPPNIPATEYERFETTADGKPICPRCERSDKVLKYLYGLRREAPPEGMIGGGCSIGPKSPEYHCSHCDTRFGITSQGK
jgi:hypothetical protein